MRFASIKVLESIAMALILSEKVEVALSPSIVVVAVLPTNSPSSEDSAVEEALS